MRLRNPDQPRKPGARSSAVPRFTLNWMSGQSGIDIAGIQDERAHEMYRLLLNLIESPTADLRKSQAENLYLREQLNRRKGGGGKPDQPKDTAGPKSQSSEKETGSVLASGGCGVQRLRRCRGAGTAHRYE